MDRVVFLDRDRTINQEVHYLHKSEDLVLLPDVPEAIRTLWEAGFRIAVVANRTGVARDYYTCQEVEHPHAYLSELLEKDGAHIDYFFYCPHHPEHGIGEYKIECDYRKPEAGAFRMAKQYYQIDKAHSYIIRGRLLNVEAGRDHGVRSILVDTGYGTTIYREQETSAYDFCAETLIGTARYIIDRRRWRRGEDRDGRKRLSGRTDSEMPGACTAQDRNPSNL